MSDLRPDRAAPSVARRGTRRRWRPAGDDARDGHPGRTAVGASRPPARPRRARSDVLHEPHVAQGRRAPLEPARGGRDPLVGARAAGARRGHGRGAFARGVGRVLGRPARGEARSRPGRRRSPVRSTDRAAARRARRRRRSSDSRTKTSRYRRSGAATASSPTRSSSGRTGTTDSTTACATSARAAAGAASASRRSYEAGASAPSVYRPSAFQSM